jgi:hypothetical protein
MGELYIGLEKHLDIARPLALSVKVCDQFYLFIPVVTINYTGIAFLRDAANLPGVDFASMNATPGEVKVSYGVVTATSFPSPSLATSLFPESIGEGEKDFMSQFAFEVSKHRCYEREMDGLTAKVAF